MDSYYIRNRFCPCARCKSNDLFGPIMMITTGVLLLLHMLHVRSMGSTYPVLFIVIGGMMLLRSGASTEGHRNPPGVPLPATIDGQVNNG